MKTTPTRTASGWGNPSPKNQSPEPTNGQKVKGLRTCEEDRAAAAPPVLEPAPAHDHATVIPVEVCNVRDVAGGPLGLPEEDHPLLELLWVSGGVGEPTLDHFVIE